MHSSRGVAAAFVALVLGCASSGGGEAEPRVEVAPVEILMARELVLPAPVEFAPADGLFRASAATLSAPDLKTLEDGVRYGVFDIGATAGVECLFSENDPPVGATLGNFASTYIGALGGAKANLTGKQLISVDASAVGTTPYLSTDWYAFLDAIPYHVKFKLANKNAHGILCAHAETGYVKTFEDFFRGLVGSYEGGLIPDPVQFRDITTIALGEMTIGYMLTETTREDGAFKTVLSGASMFPSGVDSVSTSDDYSVEFAGADGTLIRTTLYSSDGVATTDLALEPVDVGWEVTGEMQGKPIDARFESASGLASSSGQYELFARVAREEPAAETAETAETRFELWAGSLDPTRATEVVLRSLGGSRVEAKMGPVLTTSQIDAQGFARGTLEVGRLVMTLERIYVEGKP